MKANLKKEGNNTISINVLGFEPQIVSYEEFFSKTIYGSNKYCYVDSFQYEDSSIIINKIDPGFNHYIKDCYELSFELTKDEKFMTLLNQFLIQYSSQLEQLNQQAKERISSRNYEISIRNLATEAYIKYCQKGQLPDYCWDETTLRVANMCRTKKDWVSEYSSDGITTEEYRPKLTDLLYKVSGLSFLTTGAFVVGAIGAATKNIPITGTTECYLATGITASLSLGGIGYRVAKDLNKLYASKKLDEMAKKIEQKLNLNKILDGPILPQPRLTL